MTPRTTGSSWPSAWGSDHPVVTELFIAVTVLLVGLVAWFALNRSNVYVATREPSVLFEVDEAIEFVASALPADISARLSYEDVEALLGWHMVHLAGREGEDEVDIVDDRAVADLLRAAEGEDRDISEADVRAVLAAEVEYLVAVGAVRPDGDAPET